MPPSRAAAASIQAAAGGNPDTRTDNAPTGPINAKPATSQREGRHSSRQGADAFHKRLEIDIVRGFVSEEPAPEPIVLAVQQP